MFAKTLNNEVSNIFDQGYIILQSTQSKLKLKTCYTC